MIKSMPSTYRMAILFALAACLSLVCTYQIKAQTIPDYNVFVSSSLTATGGDPNIIDPASIYAGIIGNHQAGSPLLIIVATPTGSPTPSLSNVTLKSGTFDGLTFTNGVNSSNTLSTSQNVYTQLGLPGPDSQSYTNYSTFDTSRSIPVPTTFTLNVFAVDCALGTSTCTTLHFDLENSVAGTFLSAATCSVQTSAACANTMDNFGATPFTTGGAVVPEPVSMLLFGTGLVAMGAKLRRRKSRNPVIV